MDSNSTIILILDGSGLNYNIPESFTLQNVDGIIPLIQSSLKNIPTRSMSTRQEQEVPAPKRKKVESPQEDVSDDDDGSICPICFERWTTYGERRISSLKCGHLFCLKCINRWFDEHNYTCPTCKKRAIKSHIRHIYAKKLSAVDTTDYETMKRELNEVSVKNAQLQIELTKRNVTATCLKETLDRYKLQFSNFIMNMSANDVDAIPMTLCKDKSLEISKEPGCRVLDHNIKFDLVVAGAKSTNSLFGSYGIHKINVSTYTLSPFIPLHSSSIRDIKFHPQDSRFVTVSFDKQIKVVDALSNKVITSTKCKTALWSCSWSRDSSHMLYVGDARGAVSKFDVRKITNPINIIEAHSDKTPVVSLVALERKYEVPESLLICQLRSVWAFEGVDNERLSISEDGPFASMSYDDRTNYVLLDARPNTNMQHSRHIIYKIEESRRTLSCDIVHSIVGDQVQSHLTRSCFVENKSRLYVVAYQELHKDLCLWNANNRRKVCFVPAPDIIFDICNFNLDNNCVVAALTEKNIDFFKFL